MANWSLLGHLRKFTAKLALLTQLTCCPFEDINILNVLKTARSKLGRIELNRSGVGPTLTNMLQGNIRRSPNSPLEESMDGLTETKLLKLLVPVTRLLTRENDASLTRRVSVPLLSMDCSLLKQVLVSLLLWAVPLSMVIWCGNVTWCDLAVQLSRLSILTT